MNIQVPKRMESFTQPSVWLEFSPLSKITNSINLGQGFPDWSPPDFILENAKIDISNPNLAIYARSAGHLNLVQSIANNYSNKLNHKIIPQNEVLVTVGATEALFLSVMSFIEKNDEVIIIEPAFDIYLGVLKMAQAKIKPVKLIPKNSNIDCSSELELDWNTLEQTISKDTKAIILNTPHNPTGKVFSKTELERLASILNKFPDCLVISDEVYEHLVYDGEKHISIASLPNMFDRTISIFSAGKTFSVTGWKIGWIVASEQLIRRMSLAHQWVVFSVSTPHQETIAKSLYDANSSYKGQSSYYEWLLKEYAGKRELLFNGLKDIGFKPIKPQGSFFIICPTDHSPDPLDQTEQIQNINNNGLVQIDSNTHNLKDYNICRKLSLQSRVTSIPTSAFYLNPQSSNNWIRFAFCKDNQTIKTALENLKSLR
jgi:kynurenine--oxoglutarate transaminase/cysteine-S-conjugate beta-lyase/glutamine--phenylpyruvate transaminase